MRRASPRRDLTLTPAPALVAALLALGFVAGPLAAGDGGEREGEWAEEWEGELASWAYGELAHHDTPEAALLVRTWWALPPGHEEATPARRDEELGRDRRDATLTIAYASDGSRNDAWAGLGLADFDVAEQMIARGFAVDEPDAPDRDEDVFLLLVPAGVLEDAMGELDALLERERSHVPDAVAVVVVIVSDD